ncbi:MAG: tyrosine-type recombinase/integrase [Candidatus Bathyarchaeia archaeon]
MEAYGFKSAIERYRRIIGRLGNGDLALSFLDHLASLGLSSARIAKYAGHLIAILRVVDFNLAEATRKQVERVVAWINSQPYSEWTKHDKKLALKKIVQYAKFGRCEKGAPYPPEVSWIKLRVRDKDSRITPESLLAKADFEALVRAAENSRDKAMLYVLFEGALRPGELLGMNVGSVEFRDQYCLITVSGKTGLKRLPLVVSFRSLLEWLNEHPTKDNPNAPLWCSLAANYKGRKLSYRHFRLIIKRLAKKAGLRKAVWPYLFRHSTLTALAKVFTEARLEQFAGWVHGSKMAARYVHFSARDLENAVLEIHGLAEPRQGVEVLKLTECPRCKYKNAPGTVRCGFCGLVLDKEFAAKIDEEERRKDESIIKRIENLERLVYAMLSGHNAFPEQAFSALQAQQASARDRTSGQQRTPPFQTQSSPKTMHA